MKNRVYLAGPYTNEARAALRERRAELREAGYDVQSRWLDDPRMDPQLGARVDIGEVGLAGIVVISADLGPSTAGGMWCEMGAAIALDKEVYIVPGLNELPVFRHLAHVFGDWPSLLVHLQGSSQELVDSEEVFF